MVRAGHRPAGVGRRRRADHAGGPPRSGGGPATLWFALDTDLPVLVDADGLTMLADHPDLVAGRQPSAGSAAASRRRIHPRQTSRQTSGRQHRQTTCHQRRQRRSQPSPDPPPPDQPADQRPPASADHLPPQFAPTMANWPATSCGTSDDMAVRPVTVGKHRGAIRANDGQLAGDKLRNIGRHGRAARYCRQTPRSDPDRRNLAVAG